MLTQNILDDLMLWWLLSHLMIAPQFEINKLETLMANDQWSDWQPKSFAFKHQVLYSYPHPVPSHPKFCFYTYSSTLSNTVILKYTQIWKKENIDSDSRT